MGLLIFLILVGAVLVLILFIGLGLSLFSIIFGYDDDPYERDLARMDYEDAMLKKMDKLRRDRYINIDARQIHYHEYKTEK